MSPYIHPPFKIATSQSNGLGMKNVVELCASDMFRSSGVFAMELRCEFWCRNFGSGLPRIVFAAVSLPLNEVLESSPVPTTVEYFLYFPLRFSVDDYGWRVVLCLASCNRVVRGRSKLYYIEHWMELLHPVWQSQAIGHRSDPPFYYEGAKSSMRKFLRRACSPDVRCIEEDFVARFEHRSRSSLSVIIPLHVILCFADCGFGFINCRPHPLRELVDRF